MRKYLAHAMAVTAVTSALVVSAAAPAAAQNSASDYIQDALQCAAWLAAGDPQYAANCTPSHVLVSFKSLSEPGNVGGPPPTKETCEGRWCECEHGSSGENYKWAPLG